MIGPWNTDLSLYINILKSQIRVTLFRENPSRLREKMEMERNQFPDASTSLLRRSSIRVDTGRA